MIISDNYKKESFLKNTLIQIDFLNESHDAITNCSFVSNVVKGNEQKKSYN